MMIKSNRAKQMLLAVFSIISWAAVLLQLVLILSNRVVSVPETLIRFFSYYTILTNILVALCFTALLRQTQSQKPGFFTNPTVLAAVTVYITVVGGVYNFILRQLWTPTGMQLVVDELLHSVIPVLFIFYWFAAGSKAGLAWKDILSWLVYPLVYFMIILLRGAFSGFYPYPFIDVDKIGYSSALLNSAYVTIVFVLLSIAVMVFARTSAKKTKPGTLV